PVSRTATVSKDMLFRFYHAARAHSATATVATIQRTQYTVAATIEYVGVDHRGLHIGMTQQLLDRAHVLAALQHVRRNTMPQRVRRGRLVDARRPLHREACQKLLDFGLSYLRRVAKLVKANKHPDPLGISGFGTNGIMSYADLFTQPIQQSRLAVHGV